MPELLQRFVRPREGWLAYLLLLAMLLSLGWAVQATGWLAQDNYLVPVAVYGSLLGALLGISGLTVVAVLPTSAVVGSLVVLWTVGGEYFPHLSQIDRLLALRFDAIDFTRTVIHLGYPSELTPYAIGLGLVMWLTAFMAAYTLYRHHRVLDAIVLVGAPLIANMSATLIDLVPYLILFVVAALLLWLRGSIVLREEGWRRRRVSENVEVPTAIMQTGVVFIGVTIALSWVLTSVGAISPLRNSWRNLDVVWSGVRDQLDGVFGGLTNPESRITGNSFGSRFTVSGKWFANDAVVLVAAEDHPYYLMTATYDVYTGHGWSSSQAKLRTVAANALLFPGTSPENPTTTDGFTATTVTIRLVEPTGRNLFTPGIPLDVSAPAIVSEPKGLPLLGALSAQSGIASNEGYSIDAAISNVSKAQLRAAGQSYPQSVRDLYLSTTGITNETRALARQIVQDAGASNPYDMAAALATYLSSHYTYSTDVGAPPANRDLVDFFLFDTQDGQRGYCQYYASAMAMMARTLGLPARVAVGFAPGTLIAPDQYEYKESNAHVWTQVFFPGYGWQTFEATKTIDPQFVRPAGASAGPSAAPSGDAAQNLVNQIDRSHAAALPSTEALPGGTIVGGSPNPTDTRSGNLIVILLVVVVAAAFVWWRWRRSGRRLRFLGPGERQWALLLQAADRAGVSQRAAETDYEYAAWLEEQIPARRTEIRTIADAKVWGSYSGRGMTSQMVVRMRTAWQRLRLPFVWLGVRRRIRSLLPHRRS